MPADLPMIDVMKLVLQAEEQSKQLMEDAEKKAAAVAEEARRRAHDLVQKMQHETAEQAHSIIESASRDGQLERQTRLDQAAEQIEAMVQLDDATSQTLIEAMLRCVNGTD